MKLNNKKREKRKQVTLSCLFLICCLFFKCSTNINAQNVEKIKFNEALKVLKKVKEGDKTPIVAVIDGGLKKELFNKEVFWINKKEIQNNGIDDDKNGYIDDYFGWNFFNNSNDITNYGVGDWHGTPVFGIVESLIPDDVNIKLMSLVKGDTIDQILKSLRYVLLMRKKYNETNGREGAYIVAVNCSWGKNRLWAPNYIDWCGIYNQLGQEGVLVVSSVPNDDVNVDKVGDMPSTCTSDYIITVTNVDENDDKIKEAAYGKYSVDIGAPGNKTYSLLNTGKYGFFGGTSAAATYVSATIGLLYTVHIAEFKKDIKENPQKTALFIKRILLNGSDKSLSLKNITTSEGRLNIFNSLKMLLDYYGESKLYQNIFNQLKLHKIYPNPIVDNFNVLIESEKEERVYFNVIDLKGRKVKSFYDDMPKGFKEVYVKLINSKIKKGIYFLQIKSKSGFSDTIKFVVK